MVTARQEPRLVLVSVGCENGCLALSAPGMEPLRLPVRLPRKNPVRNCRYGGREAGGAPASSPLPGYSLPLSCTPCL